MPPTDITPDHRRAKGVSVLVADDEPVMLELVRAVLERAGITVLGEATDGAVALDRYQTMDPPDTPRIVLLDNQMPRLTGLDVAGEILAVFPSQIVVLFSAHLDDATTAAAGDLGVAACISKKDVAKLPGILDGLLDCA